ncbi:MAG: LPXTG cell wall anchor domain-containing protein [Atopobiaceae bacterium]|jgi:LPXTG-motif cell wall-anchored protein|nr:LPXTG cell wall anchor domain-containing protein [Atopobiaceae bacterium]MCI2172680.1 LPXTG cell wall anchor domain-containing protein [Atopobiaceae bacterium]MCI2206987.1 LPXTG cell wall anchor domain-containing protein [Atopobiaceae bacterium]
MMKKRIAAALASFVLTLAMIPGGLAFAADFAIDKTATWTDQDARQGEVTLDIPSGQSSGSVDVVFVIDSSAVEPDSQFPAKVKAMLSDLSKRSDLKVNVGIVSFDGMAHDSVSLAAGSDVMGGLTELNEEGLTKLNAGLGFDLHGSSYHVSGSNLEDGVKKGDEMLSGGTGDAKYMFVLSDLLLRTYDGTVSYDGQDYDVPCGKSTNSGCFLSQYDMSLTSDMTVGGDQDTNAKYATFADMLAASTLDAATGTRSLGDNGWDTDALIEFSHAPAKSLIPTLTAADYDTLVSPGGAWCEATGLTLPANVHTTTSFEKATMRAYDAMLRTIASGTNLTVVQQTSSQRGADEQYMQGIATGMVDDLATNHGAKGFEVSGYTDPDEMQQLVDNIAGKITNVIASGKVTDTIGSAWDVSIPSDGSSPFALKVGDTEASGTWDAATDTCTFDGGNYVLHYTSGDSEQIALDVKVPVARRTPIHLSYGVTLTDELKAQETDGTYTHDTNESASLEYWSDGDDTDQPGEVVDFPVPSLTFTATKPAPVSPETPTTPAAPTTPAIPDEPTMTPVSDTSDESATPKTGDTTSPMAALMIAGVGTALVGLLARRRSQTR